MNHGEIIAKAVKKALKNGWQLPFEEPIESYALVQPDQFHTENEYNIAPYIRFKFEGGGVYETGVMYTMFNHEFASALWGEDEVDDNGASLKTIQYWATQVAVEHLGTLYAVERNEPVVSILDQGPLDFNAPPEALTEVKETKYQLEKLTGSIPFNTHRINEVAVHARSLPAYLFHLQQMVIAEDPIKYLGNNL
jgi:hypothetical protein